MKKSKVAEPLTARPRLPRALCEEVLQAARENREAEKIWPSQVKVIDRMLARSLELPKVYEEVVDKLDGNRVAIEVFFDAVLGAAATWGPGKLTQARKDRAELVKVNKKIAKLSEELATALERREILNNHSGFATMTHYSVVALIQEAGRSHGRFRMYVSEPLARLRAEFGLKYWPKIADVIRELGPDAEGSEPEATDPLTEVGTAGRNGRSRFLQVMLAAMDENTADHGGFLPSGFNLSDRTLGDLMTVALDLPEEDDVDREFVKRYRQREREAERAQE